MDWIEKARAAIEALQPVPTECAIFLTGMLGGLTWFVKCWSGDKYKVRVRRRMISDAFGGMMIGYFFSIPLAGLLGYRTFFAFLLGLTWGPTAQYATERITGTVLSGLERGLRAGVRGAFEEQGREDEPHGGAPPTPEEANQ